MKKIIVLLLGISLTGFYGCKTDKTKTAETKKERVIAKKTDAQVKSEMDQLLQELDATWNAMIASDDQKIDNLGTLQARIGRDKNYDKKALSDAVSSRNTLKTQRYNRDQVGDIAKVDQYDSLQIKIIDQTNILVENTNLALRDTIAASLVNQILDDDSRVPIMRAYYDKAAKHYNQYLKDYQQQLQKLGPPYSELKPAPMFVEQQPL